MLYGNKFIKDNIINSVINKKIGHAYLFCGEKGIGKRSFSIFFIKSILCSDFSQTQGPCLKCKNCIKIDKNIHADVSVIEESDQPNSIHIEKTRQIKSNSYISANESTYKITLILNADNMTTSAFNSILKLIEDPPKNRIFILTAKNKNNLPQTILSRLIEYRLSPISDDGLISLINKRFSDKNVSEIKNIISYSNGIAGKAIDLLNDNETFDIYTKAETLSRKFLEENELDLANYIVSLSKEKTNIVKILNTTLEILHNLITKNVDEKIDNIASKTKEILEISDIIETASEGLSKNANINITLYWIISQISLVRIGVYNETKNNRKF